LQAWRCSDLIQGGGGITTYLVKNEMTISTLIQVLSAFTFGEQYS